MPVTKLDVSRHEKFHIIKGSDYSFARERLLVPVWGREIVQAAHHFPIVFTQRNGRWMPMALMGLTGDRNVAVGPDGQWRTGYIPAVLRTHPFYAIDEVGKEPVVGIDEDDRYVVRDYSGHQGTLPLFDSDGNPAEVTIQAAKLLKQIKAQQEKTWAIMDIIDSLDLLGPWSPKDEQGSCLFSGSELYMVDEKSIQLLGDQSFIRLREPGVLAVAYAHLSSLAHLSSISSAPESKASQRVYVQKVGTQDDRSLFSSDSDVFVFSDE